MRPSKLSRRAIVKTSAFGMLAVSIPNILTAAKEQVAAPANMDKDLFHRYPSIDDAIVQEVVGVSHFNLDRLKELVTFRPELARATWDWGFGDWETAIGAASHVGRRDIVSFLLKNGARPDLFTFAMIGAYESVKSMIEARPGIQAIPGPHGISLLDHARFGLRDKTLSETQIDVQEKLIAYLEALGNAEPDETYLELDDLEKQKYIGDYKYGVGEKDGFTVKLNMRKMLSLGKLGESGGSLLQFQPNKFRYNGTSSVVISFQKTEGKVVSLTVEEPGLSLIAKKIS